MLERVEDKLYDLPLAPDDSCPIGSVGGALADFGVFKQNETQVIDKIRGRSNNHIHQTRK